MSPRLLVSTLVVVALAGCGESRLTVKLVEETQTGQLKDAQGTVEDLYGTDSDDALLKGMQQGLLCHLQGDYSGSGLKLDGTAPLVDELRGAHVGDAILSSLYNDTVTTYVGRPFEHTQIDYYRTLNSLLAAEQADGRWVAPTIMVPGSEPLVPSMAINPSIGYQNAIIYARRMTINQLKETEDAGASKRYDDDPFARMLAAITVFCLAPGERVESDRQLATAMLARSLKAYKNQQEILGKTGEPFRYEVHGVPELATQLYLRNLHSYDPELFASEVTRLGFTADDPRIVPPTGSGSVLILDHDGMIARPEPLQIGIGAIGFEAKDSTSFTWGSIVFFAKGPGSDIARTWVALPIPGDAVQKILAPGGAAIIGFEIPVHAPDLPLGGPATATVGGVSRTGEVVCDLDAYARSQLKDAQPGLLLKTLLRVVAKQGLVAVGASQAKKRNSGSNGELLAFLINLLGSSLATATESADLRAWTTLPNHVAGSLIDLPAGTYPISITTVSGTHSLGTVRVDPDRLTLVSVRTMPLK